jgi:hypothetical protein
MSSKQFSLQGSRSLQNNKPLRRVPTDTKQMHAVKRSASNTSSRTQEACRAQKSNRDLPGARRCSWVGGFAFRPLVFGISVLFVCSVTGYWVICLFVEKQIRNKTTLNTQRNKMTNTFRRIYTWVWEQGLIRPSTLKSTRCQFT